MHNVLKIALLIGAVSATPAFAADPLAPYVVPEIDSVSHWDGFYAGIVGGYASANREGCIGVAFGFGPCELDFGSGNWDDWFDYNQSGGLIGGVAGANFLLNDTLLLGAEVDASLANITGRLESTDFVNGSSGGTGTWNYLATGTVQAGMTFDAFKLYVEGGMAIAGFEFNGDTGCDFSSTLSGFVAGVGAAAMVADNISLGAEYNRIWFGDTQNTCSAFGVLPVDVKTASAMDVFKLNLTYHFD